MMGIDLKYFCNPHKERTGLLPLDWILCDELTIQITILLRAKTVIFSSYLTNLNKRTTLKKRWIHFNDFHHTCWSFGNKFLLKYDRNQPVQLQIDKSCLHVCIANIPNCMLPWYFAIKKIQYLLASNVNSLLGILHF